MRYLFRVLPVLLAGMLMGHAGTLRAATYAVGPFPGCGYSNLQSALDAAVLNPNGPHLIKLTMSSAFGTSSGFTIDNANTDITIEGGYQTCDDSAPQSSGRSTLTRSSGSGFSVLAIDASFGHSRHTITLKRLSVTDGLRGSGPGGGIAVSGPVNLDLRDDTRVQGNSTASSGIGGGIAVFCATSGGSGSAANCAHLTLTDATVSGNSATGSYTNGGGIGSIGPVEITLINASIHDNTTDGNGGGIGTLGAFGVPGHAKLHIAPQTISDIVNVSNNTAGDPANFTPSRGYGGGMYLAYADLDTTAGTSEGFHLALETNDANYGGGIYAVGTTDLASDPMATVELENAVALNNTARDQGGAFYSTGGVNWTVWSTAHARCQLFFVQAPCSYFSNNSADNAHSAGAGALGGGVINIHAEVGKPAGHALFKRTLFSYNTVTNPPATVAGAWGNATLSFRRDIFIGNSGPAGSVLVESVGGTDMLFSYNTVLANSVTRLFSMTDGQINAQGSILWDPGKPIWYHNSAASMVFNDCLISHTATDIPGGAILLDPKLGADYTPGPESPAADVCDNFGLTPLPDIYSRSPVDISGLDNMYGPNDLGAVEQTDVIFYSGFGYRPLD